MGSERYGEVSQEEGIEMVPSGAGSSLARSELRAVVRRRDGVLFLQTVLLLIIVSLCSVLVARPPGGAKTTNNYPAAAATKNTRRCWRPRVDLRETSLYPAVSRLRDDELEAMQGLALNVEDDGSLTLYEAHTRGARAFRFKENDLESGASRELRVAYDFKADAFPQIPLKPTALDVAHIGGISYAAKTKKLWFAVHNDLDSVEAGALVEVDPATLLPTQKVILARDTASFDWVAVDNDENVGYAAEFFNVTVLKKFNAEDPDEALDHDELVLDLAGLPPDLADGLDFIQSGTVLSPDGDLLLLTDDYQSTLYRVDLKTGKLVSAQALLLGNEVDGLASVSGADALLVGLNRAETREGAALESIILLAADRESTGESPACGGALREF